MTILRRERRRPRMLYKHFDITPEAAAEAAKTALK